MSHVAIALIGWLVGRYTGEDMSTALLSAIVKVTHERALRDTATQTSMTEEAVAAHLERRDIILSELYL
jgi:hypothetical protein